MSPSPPSDASPQKVAEKLAATHDRSWLRSVVKHLDDALQREPLDRLMTLWGLSPAEAAQLFGVSRQAFAKWLRFGPPVERAPAIAALSDSTDLLERHVKRERVPVVVRRRSELTDKRSLLELASRGDHDKVLRAVRAMFDLRRIQP